MTHTYRGHAAGGGGGVEIEWSSRGEDEVGGGMQVSGGESWGGGG